MVLAALVFYRDHLEEHLRPNSALRACSLWNETIPSAELVVVKINLIPSERNCQNSLGGRFRGHSQNGIKMRFLTFEII